jgi:hypothetical protein
MTKEEDFTRMFEYLREDFKAAREETRDGFQAVNTKLDKLNDALTTHCADDNKNFDALGARIGKMETAASVKESIATKSWDRFAGWCGLILAAILAAITWFLK